VKKRRGDRYGYGYYGGYYQRAAEQQEQRPLNDGVEQAEPSQKA
jgi:hypothetical protein